MERSARQFVLDKFGPFLDKILELWPDNIPSSTYTRLGPTYAKILSYIPNVSRSDEDKMGNIIGNPSRHEIDLRLAFLVVVVNHFYYDYLENADNHSDESNLSRSGSRSDDESDDSNYNENSQDAYQPNGDESSSSDSSSSSSDSKKNKSSQFKARSETTTNTLSWIESCNTKKKNDKYAHAFKNLVLGVDKAIMFLYPLMSKMEKEIFNGIIINERIMRDFKVILKDNIAFLRTGILPIEKNIKVKVSTHSGEEDAVGAYLTESENPANHTSKKQKK